MATLEHIQHSFDLVVLGSGAGGFAAAATAARRGLKVLVVEKAERFGGTSAISGGAVWLYGTDQARAAGAKDSPEAMRTYLKHVIGDGYDPALADASSNMATRHCVGWNSTPSFATPFDRTPRIITPMPLAPPSLAGRWKWSSTTASTSAHASRTCKCHRPACCCSAA